MRKNTQNSSYNATIVAIMIILFFGIAIVWKWLSLNFIWATSPANLAYRKHELELEYIRNFNALQLQMFELSIYVLLTVALAFCILLAVIFYRKQRDSELWARNGLYPPMKDHFGGRVVYTNPMMPAHPMGHDMFPGEQQYQMRAAVALLNALEPNGMGQATEAKTLADKPPRKRQRKAIVQPKKLKANASVQIEPKSSRLLSFRQALEQSTSEAWILGQNEESGELAYFCPRTDVHGAIVGATGCGKTESSGLMIVLQALLHGSHVILLDGKGGLDWGSLAQYVEWQDMDYTLLPQQIHALYDLFQARMDLLKKERASTIYELERPLKPILVLLEEFGATYDALQVADKAQAKVVAVQISNMFRLARSTGISFMVIDQAPNMWPKQMRANIKSALCYRLAGRLGLIFNEYNLHKLPKVGYFSLSNATFKAWHTKAELGRLQVELPPLTEQALSMRG